MKTDLKEDIFMTEFYSIDSNEVSLKAIPIKRTAVIILYTLILIGVIFPLLVLIFFLYNHHDITHFRTVSFVLFWGAGYYMFRILSWNQSGQEKLTFGQGKTTLTAKSNHFNYNEKIISSEKVIFSSIPARQRQVNGEEVQTSKLVIRNADNLDDKVISDIEIPNDAIHQLIKILNAKSMTNEN